MSGNWQRRWQPLLEQWVIISASSAVRPWSGAMAQMSQADAPVHDPDCYLCPRVQRASGNQNPDYQGTFAFDNDYPSLSASAPDTDDRTDPLATVAPATGVCRVLCWSERHDATLAGLDRQQMQLVARLWRDEYTTLSARDDIHQVLLFENKGTEIGVSNLHPHGQIYASSFVSDTATRMRTAQARYAREHSGNSLLQNLLTTPVVQAELLVEQNAYWSVIVPFAARFAYETWIVPHRHLPSLAEATDKELDELALCYQRQVRRYDLLFQRSAPNITLLHNAPCDQHKDNEHWCFHLAFQPPLRDTEKLKYLGGFESGTNNIVNPVQPEQAAAQLRDIDTANWISAHG